MPSEKLCWGILGTGNIAHQFAEGLIGSDRGVATAVGSRHTRSAEQFAQAYRIGSHHGRYEDLVHDRRVDVVYVSLPNTMHHEWTLKALHAGKHVLCEKPFASSAAESEEMFDLAERQGLRVVEAFMYRSHDQTLEVFEKIENGAIGRLCLIRTSFCYRTTKIEGNIRFNPALAGGALMDVGCYCINFSRYFARDEPTDIRAVACMHETGVDEMVVGTLCFTGGLIASFTCGMTVQADNTAYLCGRDGFIEIPVPWKPPAHGAQYRIKHSVSPRQDKSKTIPVPTQIVKIDSADKPIFAVEADDFAATILDGAPPRVTRQDTLANMAVLDEIRRQIGGGQRDGYCERNQSR